MSLSDLRIKRLIIQEAGLPGPQGDPGDLSTTNFTPPLEYDIPSHTLAITPPPSENSVYRWDGTAWVPAVIPTRRVEHRTVTGAEASAKALTLSYSVTDASKIVFDIAQGGGPQFLDTDFELVGETVISWEGFALDGILEEGDRLRIVYE
jgi:hypothetical protein